MAMEIENIDSNMSKVDEAHVEQLLSEKLMEGYVLLEKSCPVCSTPLVKNQDEDEGDEPVEKDIEPVMIPKEKFTEPFHPVQGVPFCVACTSHVITQENEINILQKSGSLKIKGGISMMMTEASEKEAMPDPSPKRQLVIIDVTQVEDTESVYTHDTKNDADLVDEMLTEYSVRREIATKVLGAKMLQGYSLMEQQCQKCSMPTMEFQGMVECVVCPALVKKAKKKLKAQKKLEKETGRLENEVSRVRSLKAKEIEFATIAEQKRHEEKVKREKERMEIESQERQLRMLREQEAEHVRRLEMIEEERRRIAALEAEQARLVQDAMTKAEIDAQHFAEQAKSSAMRAKEDIMKLDEMRKVKALSIEDEHAEATHKRKEMENKISEDSKRLEEMEHRRRMGLATALESMKRDVLVAEHRRRLEAKAKLDLQIARLETDIMNEEMETKTVNEDKRVENEERMIALLEEEAAAKATAAEEAIRKAKAALEHVHSARREVIAQTIALAEQEVIAEAESLIKREREDYKAPVILPSDSQIRSENWETLRTEGRSIMTRRVMVGWVLLSEFCQGIECHSSPLITKDGKKECVVCGGCGDGMDGAYIDVEDYDVIPSDEQLQGLRESGVVPDEDSAGYEITRCSRKPLAALGGPTFEEIQQDFETKRDMVSKEIGKRMIEGWTLLDSSCPQCVMPLMMDPAGNNDVCVLCGLVNIIQETDGSTIKTVDVPTKTVITGEPPIPPIAFHEMEIVTTPSESQTQSYADAETMFTTLPTVYDAVTVKSAEESWKDADNATSVDASAKIEDHPAAGQTASKEEQYPRDDLTQSIRESVQRQKSSTTPRNDPPASSKPATATKKKALEPDEITQSLSNKNSKSDDDDKNTTKEDLSVGSISAMIMGTTAGQQTTLPASMSKEEVEDLVDIYVATSRSGNLSVEVKNEVVQHLQRRLEESTIIRESGNDEVELISKEDDDDHVDNYVATNNYEHLNDEVQNEAVDDLHNELEKCTISDGVIHLEDIPSPKNFKFDMLPSEEGENVSKKNRPCPEVMAMRSTGMPPRPDSARSPRRPPRSTTSRASPHHGKFIITGGVSDVTSLGEMSRAESVATDALDSILDRIDAAKATLLRDDVTVREQLEAANLIEKLAQAAVAVKALERAER